MLNFGVDITFSKNDGTTFFPQQQGNAIVVRDLRVTIDIEKSLEKEPNTCQLCIFNLAADTRRAIADETIQVFVDVGYNGARDRLFAGDVIWQRSRLMGVDWETEIQVGDGSRAFKEAQVNRSFKAGVTLETALKEVVAALDLNMPRGFVGPELSQQFASGLVLHGPAHKILTMLLDSKAAHLDQDKFSWSIQDGVLQILRESEVKRGTAVVISQDSGLIGVPESGAPVVQKGIKKGIKIKGSTKKGKPPIISFETIIKPELVPGGLVQLKSRSTNGSFKLLRVTHSADTEGDTRTTACEAVSTSYSAPKSAPLIAGDRLFIPE